MELFVSYSIKQRVQKQCWVK